MVLVHVVGRWRRLAAIWIRRRGTSVPFMRTWQTIGLLVLLVGSHVGPMFLWWWWMMLGIDLWSGG
jgi:hypothetical protein